MVIWLGIMDYDVHYMELLANYLDVHYKHQLMINMFTEPQAVARHLRDHKRLDVLIVKEDMISGLADSLPSSLAVAYLCEEKGITMISGKPAICKYQRADDIYRMILGLAASTDTGETVYNGKKKGKAIVFHGVSGGMGTSVAAMGCAAYLAGQGYRTLYLFFQQDTRISSVFRECGESMSQLRYEYRKLLQNSKEDILCEKLSMKMESLCRTDSTTRVMTFGNYDVILDSLNLENGKVSSAGIGETEALMEAALRICDFCVIDTDSIIDEKLLMLIRGASYTVLVNDGTAKGNFMLDRKFRAFRILDSNEEKLFNGEYAVLYTNFHTGSKKLSFEEYVHELTPIPRYTEADEYKIVLKLSENGQVWKELEMAVK